MDILDRLARDVGSLTEAVQAEVPDGAEKLGEAGRVGEALKALSADVDRAVRYFPIPDSREQQQWAEILATLKRESTAGLDALGRGDLGAFRAVEDRLVTVPQSMISLLEQLLETMKAGRVGR
ncbi:hypothetical protein [Planobispora longispora]|uniref:hypothetical protein n=1 Tax=Planobispora longispora TaxID=28887 RepID=UPI001EF642FC|nr:hypothetical protein [Planobispora longispora]